MDVDGTDLDDAEAKPAPGPLRRVQAFVNTLDREAARDRLASVAEAAPWLVAHGLLDAGATPSVDDLERLRDVREALRALIVGKTTGGSGGDTGHAYAATDPLRRLAAEVPVRADVDAAGVTLRPVGDSLAARLTSLLLTVAAAQLDGTWAHVKACANEGCRWVFYDRSRNHGGTWCDMSTCGNKFKNRELRARRRAPVTS